MTTEEKDKITQLSKEFAGAFEDTLGGINGTGWLIVDPLSGYLNSIGIENSLGEIPENDDRPQVLIMRFQDGTQFIPAGEDLAHDVEGVHNWMWVDPE